MDRKNDGKPQLSYILEYGAYALGEVAGVMEMGAKKYARANWKERGGNEDVASLLDSALRHQTALANGETFDPESGRHHAAHAIANLMFILYHYGEPADVDCPSCGHPTDHIASCPHYVLEEHPDDCLCDGCVRVERGEVLYRDGRIVPDAEDYLPDHLRALDGYTDDGC